LTFTPLVALMTAPLVTDALPLTDTNCAFSVAPPVTCSACDPKAVTSMPHDVRLTTAPLLI
jgi:hypothetical protein